MTRKPKIRTALTKSGHRVMLDAATPVFDHGELIGYNSYVYGNETYTTHDGCAYYAVRVFVPVR